MRREAQREEREAQREAREVRRESQREEREAQREEREVRRESQREERESQREEREAQREEREAQREAREAQREAREEEREAQREAREAQREAREVRRAEDLRLALTSILVQDSQARDSQREAREVQREAREKVRADDLQFILSTILTAVRSPPSIPGASPVLSSNPSRGSSTPESSQRSQPLSPTKEARLRSEFLAAASSGDNFNISDFRLPYSLSELLTKNVEYAHRVACKGTHGESKDFETCLEGTNTMLLPPTSRKHGLSFFIPLSKNEAVLRAAHAYHGTAHSCLAYPLRNVPNGLSLTIDKVQVSSGVTGNNVPIMLHASLSTNANMSISTFTSKVESWLERHLCIIDASGKIDNESCFEKDIGDVWGDQDDMLELSNSGDATVTLLNEVVRKLSSSVLAAELPAGGFGGV